MRRGSATSHLARAHAEQPSQERAHLVRAVEPPARGRAPRPIRAHDDALVLARELRERVLVGEIVAEREQPRARAGAVAQPAHGASLVHPGGADLHDLGAVQDGEAGPRGDPGRDPVLHLDHGRVAIGLGDRAEVIRDRPRLALHDRSRMLLRQRGELHAERLDVGLLGFDRGLPRARRAPPAPVLGDEQHVGAPREEDVERLAGTTAHDRDRTPGSAASELSSAVTSGPGRASSGLSANGISVPSRSARMASGVQRANASQ
jgi:hypothetical protein